LNTKCHCMWRSDVLCGNDSSRAMDNALEQGVKPTNIDETLMYAFRGIARDMHEYESSYVLD